MSKKTLTSLPEPSGEVTLTGQVFLAQYHLLEDFRQDIFGKILTIADASLSDPIQRKAIKDLLSQALNEVLSKLTEAQADLVDQIGRLIGDLAINENPIAQSMRINDYRRYINTNLDYTYERKED